MIHDLKTNQDEFSKLGGFDENEIDLEKVEVVDDPVTKVNTPVKPEVIPNPFEPKETDEKTTEHEENGPNKIIVDLLKAKGIKGVDKVLYEEDGEVVEKNFFDLPYEDQINILSSQESPSDEGLNEEELFYIQQARENNISLTDLIKYYTDQTLEQYANNLNTDNTIADYTDEELYVLDMKARQGDNMSDDEILNALEKELETPEIFKKKIDVLRKEYIDLEEQEKTANQLAIKEENDNKFKEYSDTITEIVSDVEDVGGVVLEDTDKKEILDFMLQRDVNGVTEFQKQMQDPESLFLAAWAITKGKDTFDLLREHYESQIKNIKKQSTSTTKKDAPVVVKPQTPKIRSVEDLSQF